MNKNIRNLLGVLGAAVFGAVLLSYLMVANFGPSGKYRLVNILLEPSFAENVSFQDGKSRYFFERFEFMYFDLGTNQWKKEQINENKYGKIYNIIKDDTSETEDLRDKFQLSNPAILTTVVRTETKENTKALQEVQFVDDYYRVLLRDDSSAQNWTYFHHPKILEQTKQAIIND